MEDRIREALDQLARAAEAAAALAPDVAAIARRYAAALASGGRLYFAGNGGSAADAQHLATEYVVRLHGQRRALAAQALTTDSSLLTAAGNDLGFEQVFARQVEALGRPGDVLILHSTSGASPNILAAARAARAQGMTVVAFTGRQGGPLRDLADLSIAVPAEDTGRIQELHLALEHCIAAEVERELAE
ncbi:MAG: D-sedoheptulose-7-phosphate isomerase [Gemmatimonadales bacterium]